MRSIEPCLCGDPECGRCFPGAIDREQRRLSCINKLYKVSCSRFFKSVLAYLLQDEKAFTDVEEICVTSDKMWLIRDVGDIGFNRFIGPVSELYRNIKDIAKVAELTEDELEYLLNCVPGGY